MFLFAGVALIRRKSIDEWGEQRLKHVLLMMYLKVDNISAAREIVDKVCLSLSDTFALMLPLIAPDLIITAETKMVKVL